MTQEEMETKPSSKFDGGLAQWIGWNILGFFVTVLTVGICYPWALCMVYGWKINHTIIEGKRLHFEGKAIGLFGLWIKWILLTIITVGIYSFWIPISLEKWRVKNTKFVDESNNADTANTETTALPASIGDKNTTGVKVGCVLVLLGCLVPLFYFIKNIPGYFFYNFSDLTMYYGSFGLFYSIFLLLNKLAVVGVAIAAIASLVDTSKNTVSTSKVNLCLILAIIVTILDRIIVPIFIGKLNHMRATYFMFQFNLSTISILVILVGAIVLKVLSKKMKDNEKVTEATNE